jgi:hypothetical protein
MIDLFSSGPISRLASLGGPFGEFTVDGDPAMKVSEQELKWPPVSILLSLLFVIALLGSGVFVLGYYLR